MIKFNGIILLGGEGSRFNDEIPKQFHRLSGKKVYLHTLDTFLKVGFFERIILVVHPEYIKEVAQEVSNFPAVMVVAGGATRQESSYCGIKASAGADFVIIHDAVRPFVTEAILRDNRDQVMVHGAVDTCIPSFDTIVHSGDGVLIQSIPERAQYLRGQTPQSFRYDWILEAHRHARVHNASDDCQLMMMKGHKVAIVSGCENNIKLTTKLDLFMAEQIMRMRTTYAAGSASLQDKLYVIVGGSGGIGSAIANALGKENARTIVLSSASVDIQDDLAINKYFESLHAEHGAIDGLINAAGVLKRGGLNALSACEIKEQLSVNLHGVIFTCKSACIKKGGHIVNIASSSFTRGRKDTPIYSAAKAGVVNFTQAIAEEFPHLCVNAVVPQRTKTALRQLNFPGEDVTSLLSPEQVAKAVVDLLKASSLTGQIIEVK